MITPEANAKQIFDNVTSSIIQACEERDWTITRSAVLKLGFTESNTSTTFTYAQRYELMVPPNIHLCLNYRSVDPSSPFQNLPDISKFNFDLSIDGKKIKSYSDEYEES